MVESELTIAQDAKEHAEEQARLTWKKKHGFKSTLAVVQRRLEEVKMEIESMAVRLEKEVA